MEGNAYTKVKPKCPVCGELMELEDIDYNFDGNQDNYWQCKCGCSATEKIRYKHRCKITIFDKDGFVLGTRNIGFYSSKEIK